MARHRMPVWVTALVALLVVPGAVPGTPVWAQDADPVVRVAGTNRIETAVAVSRATHDRATTAVVATAAAHPDALAGAVLAAHVSGPVLLTHPDHVPTSVRDELDRLGVRRTLVLGGRDAVGDHVLAQLPGARRIGGRDRYATAAAIAREITPDPERVALVTGTTFPDAVSASALAASAGWPILLTHRDVLPEATRRRIAATGARVLPIGGRAAISESVLAQVRQHATVEDRLAGPDRFATSHAIARRHLSRVDATEVWVATGMDFPDALAAGPAAAARDGVLVLSPRDRLDAPGPGADARSFIRRARACDGSGSLQRALVVGGRAALTATVEGQVESLVTCEGTASPPPDDPDPAEPAPEDPDPSPSPSAPSFPTGATTTPLPDDTVVLHVDDDASYPPGRDPDGSVEAPLPTIMWAVSYGQSLRREGRAVQILVAPGTYREHVAIRAAGEDPPPLVIQGTSRGEAVVSGADLEQRWDPVAGTDWFSAPWDQTWGLTPIPAGWDGVDVPDGVRRREAVFIGGNPLTQVLSEEELAPATFLVRERGATAGAEGQLVVHPPAGVGDLDDDEVEVARRRHALSIEAGASDVVVRNLVFEAAAAPLERAMVEAWEVTDVLLEGNVLRHSSWAGVGVYSGVGITLRDNQVIENGGTGIRSNRVTNAVFQRNEAARNNIRGATHGYVGWSVAGAKHYRLHRAEFRGNVYRNNHARGLWFDTDVSHVNLYDERACANGRDGMFIEAVQGPLSIRDSEVCDNRDGGIIVGTSGDVSILGTRLAGNTSHRPERDGQLVFGGDGERSWTDRITGESITMGHFADVTLRNNRFETDGTTPVIRSHVVSMAEWRALLAADEIRACGNAWVHPSLAGDAIRIGNQTYPMSEWREQTGDTPPPC